jgi:hypothetical protein
MELTGGIKMTEKRWRLLDWLGILLVAGTVTGIIAIWTGAWWPFETLRVPEWPFLAFFAWFLSTSAALSVYGAHLQWSNTQNAASTIEEPATAALPRLITAEPALGGIGSSRLGLDLPGASAEVDHSDAEGAELEPVLTAAGR